MNKFKLTITITLLAIIILLLGFGVFALVRANTGIANTTDFVSGDDNVFVRITGEYYGPELTTNGAVKTYYYQLTREDREGYTNDQISITPWILGNTNFTESNTMISLTFTFENLNGVNDLSIDITKIACDLDQKFTTSYIVALNENDLNTNQPTKLEPTNKTSIANLPNIVAHNGEKVYVKIIYQLQNFAESFNFENNITINFSSLDNTSLSE